MATPLYGRLFSSATDRFQYQRGVEYRIIKPLPVMIQKNAPRDFTANFRAANIAMPGETLEESLANLTMHILDVYEWLRASHRGNLPDTQKSNWLPS